MSKYYGDSSVERVFQRNNEKIIGKEFEDRMYFYMALIYKKNVKRHNNDEMDIKQGTDIELNEIRIDVTLDFSNKEYMPFIHETKIEAFAGEYFKVGIRHGNSHYNKNQNKYYSEFDKPVIVVGLTLSPKDYYTWDNAIVDSLSGDNYNNMRKLIYEIEKAYDDYMIIDKIEREICEIEHVLEKNNCYEKPEELGEFYEEHNEFQEQLEEGSVI